MKPALALPSARPSVPRPNVALVRPPASTPAPSVPAPSAQAPSVPAPSVPPPLPARAREAAAKSRAQAQAQVSEFRPIAPPKSVTRPVARPSEELVPLLFERLYELAYAEDALVAARFCLSVVETFVPCRAAMVHLFDAARREFIVVDATGDAADDLRLTKHAANDPLLRVAMAAKTPLTWGRMPESVTAHLGRLAPLGDVREMLAAPILSGPRWLGCIELVDPTRGPFGVGHENALAYVADCYARYLGEHGVIVDLATVARFANG